MLVGMQSVSWFKIQDHFIISSEKLHYGILTYITINNINKHWKLHCKVVPHKRESKIDVSQYSQHTSSQHTTTAVHLHVKCRKKLCTSVFTVAYTQKSQFTNCTILLSLWLSFLFVIQLQHSSLRSESMRTSVLSEIPKAVLNNLRCICTDHIVWHYTTQIFR